MDHRVRSGVVGATSMSRAASISATSSLTTLSTANPAFAVIITHLTVVSTASVFAKLLVDVVAQVQGADVFRRPPR